MAVDESVSVLVAACGWNAESGCNRVATECVATTEKCEGGFGGKEKMNCLAYFITAGRLAAGPRLAIAAFTLEMDWLSALTLAAAAAVTYVALTLWLNARKYAHVTQSSAGFNPFLGLYFMTWNFERRTGVPKQVSRDYRTTILSALPLMLHANALPLIFLLFSNYLCTCACYADQNGGPQ